MRHIVTALAVLVMLLVAFSWWRGRHLVDSVMLVTPAGKLHALAHHRGSLVVLTTNVQIRKAGRATVHTVTTPADFVRHAIEQIQQADTAKVNALGIRCYTGATSMSHLLPRGDKTLIVVPPWSLCAAAGLAIIAPVMKRRPRSGHCRACGYDLRASVDCCPECGTAIELAPENSVAAAAANG
jgi:hypothetical protein